MVLAVLAPTLMTTERMTYTGVAASVTGLSLYNGLGLVVYKAYLEPGQAFDNKLD